MLKLFLSPSVWGKKILLARPCGRVHCCVTSTLSGYMEIHKTLFFNIRLETRLALGDQMTAWQYHSTLTKLPLLYLRSLYFHLLTRHTFLLKGKHPKTLYRRLTLRIGIKIWEWFYHYHQYRKVVLKSLWLGFKSCLLLVWKLPKLWVYVLSTVIPNWCCSFWWHWSETVIDHPVHLKWGL